MADDWHPVTSWIYTLCVYFEKVTL
jgi:hypothetical protein